MRYILYAICFDGQKTRSKPYRGDDDLMQDMQRADDSSMMEMVGGV